MKYIRDVLLAKVYCLNKQYKQALKAFNRVININDEYKGIIIEFNYFLGLTYLKLNEKEKASEMLKKVYEEDNQYLDIKNLIDQVI